MSVRYRLVIVLALPLLLGMRDPFQPPEDFCGAAKLPQWRYHGAIISQERKIALLRDAAGVWRRVQPDTELPGGWQVLRLTERELLITTGIGCDSARWRWPREGLKNETKDSFTTYNTAVAAMSDGTTTPGVADGR